MAQFAQAREHHLELRRKNYSKSWNMSTNCVVKGSLLPTCVSIMKHFYWLHAEIQGEWTWALSGLNMFHLSSQLASSGKKNVSCSRPC